MVSQGFVGAGLEVALPAVKSVRSRHCRLHHISGPSAIPLHAALWAMLLHFVKPKRWLVVGFEITLAAFVGLEELKKNSQSNV